MTHFPHGIPERPLIVEHTLLGPEVVPAVEGQEKQGGFA